MCETLFREIYLAAAQAPNRCNLKFLPRECHDDLQMMRRMLEEGLAATNDGCYRVERGVRCPTCDGNLRHDAVVLALGLCGNTVLGLRAPDVPLVLFKVHDCNGLLLSGNDRYVEDYIKTAGFNWHVETKPIIMPLFHRLLAGE